MKGTYLGEFQELVLLTILVLEDQAYGVSIQQELKSRIGRDISRGALHTALSRLEDKGFIDSKFGGATAERGGRRKRFYNLTKSGKFTLEQTREVRRELWKDVSEVALKQI